MLDFLKNKHFLLKFETFESNFKWSRRQDSNLRPLVPKTSALPSCATSRFNMVRPKGVEPLTFRSVV